VATSPRSWSPGQSNLQLSIIDESPQDPARIPGASGDRTVVGLAVAGRTWKVGDAEVVPLVEIEAGDLVQRIIAEATPKAIREIGWLRPHFADVTGRLKAVVQGFYVRADDHNVLVDTGVGNQKKRPEVPEWDDLRTGFLDLLGDVGLTPADIDIVACTHLHADHVGWNTRLHDGEWVPTFPHARYLFARPEYDHTRNLEREVIDGHSAFSDSVVPIVEAGLADFVDLKHQITTCLRFVPSEGHTPGHASVHIESGGEHALISGDFLHHPCQIANPHWSTEADTDPDQATATRRRLLDELADTSTLLFGSHFADPVAGRVVREVDNYVFVTE
jgi:glyoxylase-like metal-dependent hydrolase (beta-lactamase superfamily II)